MISRSELRTGSSGCSIRNLEGVPFPHSDVTLRSPRPLDDKSLALIGNASAQARDFWGRQDGDGPRHCR